MGVHVLAVYRPKPGGLRRCPRDRRARAAAPPVGSGHRPPGDRALRASDGTVVELFEWHSESAIAAIHEHPDVLAMWGRCAECSDYATLADLPNAAAMLAEFELIGTYRSHVQIGTYRSARLLDADHHPMGSVRGSIANVETRSALRHRKTEWGVRVRRLRLEDEGDGEYPARFAEAATM